MKLYGYVLPPYPVVDFVPLVYSKGDEYFIAVPVGESIGNFYKIGDQNKKEALIDMQVSRMEFIEGDPFCYCYLPPVGKPIFGSKEQIFDQLLSYLYHPKINLFARLSLAQFFELTGLKKRLVVDINRERQKVNAEYELLDFDDPVFVKSHNDHEILANKITGWQELLDSLQIGVEWNDIFYIHNDQVFFGNYACNVLDFFRHQAQAPFLLNAYISKLALEAKTTLFVSSKGLYGLFMNGKIIFPTSKAESAIIAKRLLNLYEIETEGFLSSSGEAEEEEHSLEELKNFRLQFQINDND